MSLNNIKLDPITLVGLYRTSLVETGITKRISEVVAEVPSVPKQGGVTKHWKFLGEFGKNILIMVRYETLPVMPDEQLNFLVSVLNACKIGLGDVAILNMSNVPSTRYKDVRERFNSSFVIMFGFTPAEFEMPLGFPEFQVQSFDQCTYLCAPELKKVESDKVLKSKLWVSLKKMFNLR